MMSFPALSWLTVWAYLWLQMGSQAVANQTAYMNGRTAGCAACSDTPPQPAIYSCAQQVTPTAAVHPTCFVNSPLTMIHKSQKSNPGTALAPLTLTRPGHSPCPQYSALLVFGRNQARPAGLLVDAGKQCISMPSCAGGVGPVQPAVDGGLLPDQLRQVRSGASALHDCLKHWVEAHDRESQAMRCSCCACTRSTLSFSSCIG